MVVRGPDVNRSAATATLEGRGAEGPAVRLGLGYARRPGGAGRAGWRRRPYASMADLVADRGGEGQVEALATAGAFGSLGLERRAALWAAGAVAQARADRSPGTAVGAEAPQLPNMSLVELGAVDLWATGLFGDSHLGRTPRAPGRARRGPRRRLAAVPAGTRVLVGGVVTHRQRLATAGGTTFLNIETTGLVNVICSRGVRARLPAGWQDRRRPAGQGRLAGRGRDQRDRRPAPAPAAGRRHPSSTSR